MPRLTQTLIPPSQRQSIDSLNDAMDLSCGDKVSKRTGYMIMLTLAGMIAIAGVLADSTATVIGAMIIAPLGTPILGIALGIVTGHLSLVLRSIMWVLIGVVVVVVLGLFFSLFVALVIAGSIVFTMAGYARDPASSQVANRRRAYIVVTVLALIVALPLAANSSRSRSPDGA
jgi:uncharacterized membrane protein